ncbi:MAG: hypothetical protein R3300_15125 [Candidatus Promineifilaceae bacterium]|nr:hypothetical protein [Candidatus Promineifilaceae bacterium]
MTSVTSARGLTCPNCAGVVPVPEGARVVVCPFCEMRSLVSGDRGVRRWQVINQLDRPRVQKTVQGFFSGFNRARDLKRKAEIRETFLVYLPYWRVRGTMAGWMFGRVRRSKDSTRPVEVEVLKEMRWGDAATDVSEFGVHRVPVHDEQLQPYDAERLHAEGMVFEPVESPDAAQAEAEAHFTYRARQQRRLDSKYFERFHLLRPELSLVYYPLWITRYGYRQRSYQVVVDGASGEILYGKAPGNILYRAAMLVGGMALGNFILINGTAIAAAALSASDDGDGLVFLLVPIAVGAGLIALGYRRFRYGEQVEIIKEEARKAPTEGGQGSLLRQAFDLAQNLSSDGGGFSGSRGAGRWRDFTDL